MLDPVYAVQITTSTGRKFLPRSDAMLTERWPKLWAKRRQAEHAMRSAQRRGHSSARVVTFQLREET